MAIHHQSLRRLLYFQQIVEAGSLRSAADRLNVSTPVVSSTLADLEEQMQLTLLKRSTRRLELTEAGRAVFRNASEMLKHASAALDVAAPGPDLAGTVAATVPSEIAVVWLAPVLENFAQRFPGVQSMISVSDEVEDLDNSAYDLALRAKFFLDRPSADRLPDDTLALLPLALVVRDDVQTVAGDDGWTLRVNAPLLGSNYLQTHGIDALHRETGQKATFTFQSGFTISSRQTALELCLRGLGVAHLTGPSVQASRDRGALQEVAPDYSFGYIAVFMVFRDAYPSPSTRAFAAVARDHTSLCPVLLLSE